MNANIWMAIYKLNKQNRTSSRTLLAFGRPCNALRPMSAHSWPSFQPTVSHPKKSGKTSLQTVICYQILNIHIQIWIIFKIPFKSLNNSGPRSCDQHTGTTSQGEKVPFSTPVLKSGNSQATFLWVPVKMTKPFISSEERGWTDMNRMNR